MELTDKDLKRFFSKVVVTDGCWLWTASTIGNGYGGFSLGPRMVGAHRVSYAIHFWDPGELEVCHSCDVRICVNPEHLWEGTHLENMTDMVIKNRLVTPDRLGSFHTADAIERMRQSALRRV